MAHIERFDDFWWLKQLCGVSERFLLSFRMKNVKNNENFCSFLLAPGPWKIFALPSLQWHSRLARRTYKSVLTKKCEGREFEPPLEQGFTTNEIVAGKAPGPAFAH